MLIAHARKLHPHDVIIDISLGDLPRAGKDNACVRVSCCVVEGSSTASVLALPGAAVFFVPRWDTSQRKSLRA